MRRILSALPFAALAVVNPSVADETFRGADFRGMDKEVFENAVRGYILEHPEVIIEALERFEAREREQQKKAASEALVRYEEELFHDPSTPISGNENGDVTIVEFFDYQCGFCKRALDTILDILEEDDGVRVVWKELPILGPASEFAARAAMAAHRQGKYFEFHTAVMSSRGRLTPEKVMGIASEKGVNIDRLKRDMNDPAIAAYLNETLRLARALGVNGTPGFVIGDKLIPGVIDKDRMMRLIADVRNQS